MDMSGSVVNSGAVSDLEMAASSFAEKLGKTQQIAVYAFDGSKDIYPITGFTGGGGTVRAGLGALHSFKPRDPSTNLHGAIIEALKVLDKQMQHATMPLRFATLVVFTDGSDSAHRVSHADLERALDQAEGRTSVFVIGVGAEIDPAELQAVGRSGAVLSKNPAEVKAAFEKVATRVEAFTKSFYLLSYCSPARAGEHDVRISADSKGRGSGSLSYHFNAKGFEPNCDPNTPPAFDVMHPGQRRKGAPKSSPSAQSSATAEAQQPQQQQQQPTPNP
jgi:hypothetical protein